MKAKLRQLLTQYNGEFDKLFTEIGQYNFGKELGIAKVYYSNKYKFFKVRSWYNTYYKSDFGIETKNAKDIFYDLEGNKVGKSLTGALIHWHAVKFIEKYSIKPDFDKFLLKKSELEAIYFKKNKDNIMKELEKDLFSNIKALFVSMITDKSKKAKDKLLGLKN